MKSRAPKPKPELPPPCSWCMELRNWYRDPTTGGLERCPNPECERGRKLKEGLGRKRRKHKRRQAYDGRMAGSGDRS